MEVVSVGEEVVVRHGARRKRAQAVPACPHCPVYLLGRLSAQSCVAHLLCTEEFESRICWPWIHYKDTALRMFSTHPFSRWSVYIGRALGIQVPFRMKSQRERICLLRRTLVNRFERNRTEKRKIATHLHIIRWANPPACLTDYQTLPVKPRYYLLWYTSPS